MCVRVKVAQTSTRKKDQFINVFITLREKGMGFEIYSDEIRPSSISLTAFPSPIFIAVTYLCFSKWEKPRTEKETNVQTRFG